MSKPARLTDDALPTSPRTHLLTPEGYEGVLVAAVVRLGGVVEGLPTGRHNFLQRIDELRRVEDAHEHLLAEFEALRAEMQSTMYGRHVADRIAEILTRYANSPCRRCL